MTISEMNERLNSIVNGSNLTRLEVSSLSYMLANNHMDTSLRAVSDFLMYAERISPEVSAQLDFLIDDIVEDGLEE